MICYHDTIKATQFLFENSCKSKQIKAAPGEKNQHSRRTSRKFLETRGVYIFLKALTNYFLDIDAHKSC